MPERAVGEGLARGAAPAAATGARWSRAPRTPATSCPTRCATPAAEVDVVALYRTVAEPLGDDGARRRAGRRLGHLHQRVVGALLPRRRRHARRPAPGLDRPGHERGAARARLRARPRGRRSHAGRARRRARDGRRARLSARPAPHGRGHQGAGVPSSGSSAVVQLVVAIARHAPGDRAPVGAVVDGRGARRTTGATRRRATWRAGRRRRRPREEAGCRRAPRALGRDYAAPTRCQRASAMRAGPSCDGSAGRRRLALGGDAGHRVGPALGLVLAFRARLGNAERRLFGLVGRQPAGSVVGGARLDRSWPTRYPASERLRRLLDSPRADDGSDHLPVRLRPRRRVRRRVPRRHGADRARRRASSTSATASTATTCAPARSCCAARCPTSRPACTSRSSTPRSAASAAPWRCAPPRTTASSSGPTTACSRWPSSASEAPWRPSTSRARRTASSRRRRPSTGATCSPRWPRTWPPARRWPTRATRSTPTSSRRCTRPAPVARTAALVAHALAFDRFGNVMLDVEHDELAGSGLKLGHRVTINDELAPLRDDVRRRPAGRAAALRGRLPDARAGRQPRLGGAAPGPRPRRRGPHPPGVSALGRPRLHLRDDDVDQRPRPRAGARRARRTGRS